MKYYLARDNNGALYLYLGFKPIKQDFAWEISDNPYAQNICLSASSLNDECLFPDVKFSDDEPTEVYIFTQKCGNEQVEDQTILQEAEEIVNGNRQSDYGDAAYNFHRIANIVNSMYPHLNINSQQCCAVLMAVKLIREGFRHKRDNLVDLCGYAHIMNEIVESEKKEDE